MPVQNIDAIGPRLARPGVQIYCESTKLSRSLSILHVGTSVPVVDLRTAHRMNYGDSRNVLDTRA
eukprot:1325724-Lingulodinium_polyedra.AAC.1